MSAERARGGVGFLLPMAGLAGLPYDTVIGVPDALKLLDTIGENYKCVCEKSKK